jgi:hypothetical protein
MDTSRKSLQKGSNNCNVPMILIGDTVPVESADKDLIGEPHSAPVLQAAVSDLS